MLKLLILAALADGGLFLINPQFGALGVFALILGFFIIGVVRSTR